MYNYNHLYYFYVTAKSGGVMTAAKHLRISQPSLSSQLKLLEKSLDVRLFHRVGRRNELTEAGAVIYGFCRRMFELAEEMEELVSKRLPSAMRRIHVGVSAEVDRPFVVEVVSLFLKRLGLTQRPKVTVVSGEHALLVEKLRFRELDAVVSELPGSDPDLSNLKHAEVPVVLTCAATSRPRGKSIEEVTGARAAQWVMPSSRFKLRSETDRFFETHLVEGRIVFESDVVASLVRSVIDEIGFAFLPLLYISREVREKSIRVVGPKGGYWKYKVWLVCHRQNGKDPLIESLARSFKEVCDQSASF